MVEVIGDDGKPFVGTVTEKVESTVNGEPSPTREGPERELTNGQYGDMAAPAGIVTMEKPPNDSQIASISDPMENKPTRLEQIATYTVRGPTTRSTLMVVHRRIMTNVDGAGNLRPVKNGTRFTIFSFPPTVNQINPEPEQP